MILLIDNYDSFVHNLGRYLENSGETIRIVRNDKITISEIKAMSPSAIVISPGPCTPDAAGVSLALVRELAPSIPMLGVCLGHQAIGQAFGGRIVKVPPCHGEASMVTHCTGGVFEGLPNPMPAGRYHSLAVDMEGARDLMVTARADGIVMGLAHKTYPCHGVQFHPESILTPYGAQILDNFLAIAADFQARRGRAAA